jgi:hypothetical protein
VKKYRTILRAMLQNMELHMGELEKEQLRYEDSSENLYEFMYNETNTYFKLKKNRKIKKRHNPSRRMLLLILISFMNTPMILSKFFGPMNYFLQAKI